MTATPPPPDALAGPHADDVGGTLVEQAAAIRRGELSSRELTGMYLARIEASELNAFIRTRGDEVLAEAAALDDRRDPLGPLHGIPLAIKDNLFTAGTPTSGGAGVLENFVPAEDAEVVRLLSSLSPATRSASRWPGCPRFRCPRAPTRAGCRSAYN